MVFTDAFLHVHIKAEIIGLIALVLVFWLITEITGWKSSTAPYDLNTSANIIKNATERRMFGNLPTDCAVFHDIDTGHERIDHILLSREYGLFIIETKQHPGRVTATSSLLINQLAPEQDFFVRILWNTFWLREKVRKSTKLDVTVTPVIVFENATVDATEPINGVLITDPDNLSTIIRKTTVNANQTTSLWTFYKDGAQIW